MRSYSCSPVSGGSLEHSDDDAMSDEVDVDGAASSEAGMPSSHGSQEGSFDEDDFVMQHGASGNFDLAEDEGRLSPADTDPLPLDHPTSKAANALINLLSGGVPRLHALAMADQRLNNTQASSLAVALSAHTQLRSLQLERCFMSHGAARGLLDAAARLPCLTALSVSELMDSSAAQTSTLLTQVAQFTRLNYLALEELAGLDDAPPAAVTAALTPLTALRHLVIIMTGSTVRSASFVRAVLAAVRHIPCLESLTLDGDAFQLGPTTCDLWRAVAAGECLTRLTLGMQRAPHAACAGLACLAKLTDLQHLDYVGCYNSSDTPMQLQSARALAAALLAMPRLTHLNIGGTWADAPCVGVLVPAIGNLPALRELGLQHAFDPVAAFTSPGTVLGAYSQHVPRLTALRVLTLMLELGASSVGRAALGLLLRSLPRLEVASMTWCNLRAAGAAAVCSAVSEHASVTYLDLSNQDLSGRQEQAHHHHEGASHDSYTSLRPAVTRLGTALGCLTQLRTLVLSRASLDLAATRSLVRKRPRLDALEYFDVSSNALCSAGLALLGGFAATLTRLERLNVSEQRDKAAGVYPDWLLSAASLRALARELWFHAAPEQILVEARGCCHMTDQEEQAVRDEDGGALRWDISCRA